MIAKTEMETVVRQDAMPIVGIWMRLILIVGFVAIGSALVRNITDLLHSAVYGGAPIMSANR